MPNHKKKHYDAEFEVRWLLEHGGTVDFHGSTLVLPEERKFGNLDGVRAYVEKVWAWSPVAHVVAGVDCPSVVERLENDQAHYSIGRHEIAINPGKGRVHTRWAMREIVVLHEMAHAASRFEHADHGPKWAGAFLELTRLCIGPEVSLLLMAAFDQRGMSFTIPKQEV